VNANFANERFLHFLGTLQPPQEIVDLQMAMMEGLFKAKIQRLLLSFRKTEVYKMKKPKT